MPIRSNYGVGVLRSDDRVYHYDLRVQRTEDGKYAVESSGEPSINFVVDKQSEIEPRAIDAIAEALFKGLT